MCMWVCMYIYIGMYEYWGGVKVDGGEVATISCVCVCFSEGTSRKALWREYSRPFSIYSCSVSDSHCSLSLSPPPSLLRVRAQLCALSRSLYTLSLSFWRSVPFLPNSHPQVREASRVEFKSPSGAQANTIRYNMSDIMCALVASKDVSRTPACARTQTHSKICARALSLSLALSLALSLSLSLSLFLSLSPSLSPSLSLSLSLSLSVSPSVSLSQEPRGESVRIACPAFSCACMLTLHVRVLACM